MSIFKSNESSDVVKKTIWDRDGGSSDAIALIGGGNVGKETLLEGLTKNIPYEKSYPETSVLMQYGRIAGSKQPIFNVPGDLLFSSASDGEFIAKRIFFEERANKIIFVADAKNLKASLAHFLYCSEFGLPMIFNVNMIDQAQLQGIEIDLPKLEQLLGTKVHTTIGIERMGVNQLRDLLDGQLPEAHSVLYPEVLDNYLSMFSKLLPDAGVGVKQLALSLLVGDKFATKYFEQKFSSEQRQTVNSLISSVKSQFSREISNYLFDIYHNRAEEIYGQVVTTKERSYSLSLEGKFGIWSRNLTTGIPIAVVIIAAMFFIVGRFGAEWLVGWTEGVFFGEILNPMVEGWLATINTPFLTDMIVGEFGLLSVGIPLP
ncbi:MAG: ferrous iron transporter B, partial [Bdellovibrionales bacterium]|nr:ferrous iron transporter B [Bdellovibrionales bacterium]